MQDQASTSPEYDLSHYLRPLRRHRRTLVTAVVVGLALGLAVTVVKHPTYTSTAAINVNPTPSLPGQASTSVNPTNSRTNGQVNLDTEAQVVKSGAVAARAQAILHSTTSVSALRARVTASVPANSTILHVSCKAHSPSAAEACARAFATAYLASRQAGEQAAISSQVASTEKQLSDAEVVLHKASVAISKTQPATSARNYAFANQSIDQNAVTNLRNQLNQLNTTVVDPGQIVTAAGPGLSSKANRVIPPLTGLILGLLIGLGLVYGGERYDKLVRHEDDLAGRGVGTIAAITPGQGRNKATRRRRERIARTRFDQRVASVVAGSFDAQGGVVYVAPVSPEQAPDDVARNLAATLASVGHQVAIVSPSTVETTTGHVRVASPVTPDTDATSGSHASRTRLGWPSHDDAASTDVTVGTPEVDSAVVEAENDSVPMSLRMRVDAARRNAQFVIIDGDPAVTDAQAYILAGLSDATLLVVDPDQTTRVDLEEVVDQISVTGSFLLGAVIWRPDRRDEGGGAKPGRSANKRGGTDPKSARSSTSPLRGRDDSAAHAAARPTPPRAVDAAR